MNASIHPPLLKTPTQTGWKRIITDRHVCVCKRTARVSTGPNTVNPETATRRGCVQNHTHPRLFFSRLLVANTTTTLLHYYYNNNTQPLNYYTSITDSWGCVC